VKYKGGVMIAADTLASYGSMARFKNVERMAKVGTNTLLAAGGEISDFQHIKQMMSQLETRDYCANDGCELQPGEVHTYLTRTMYQRRNKMNPLWNSLVIAGFHNGENYLGTVDSIATSYTDDHIATGYGEHLARPLMRSRWSPEMTEGDARALLEDCMRVLFYRDCRTINRIQIAKATVDGTLISPVYSLETKWDYQQFVDPKAGSENGGSW
jgi:20S proteasome subunit beta 7